MEKLRENYTKGEKFYAEDMNKMTHIIDKLDGRVIAVEDLPDTGETGVIYIMPNFDEENEFNSLGIFPIDKDGNDYYFTFDDAGIEDEKYPYVGDIIKVKDNYTGETAYVPTSVNPDELKIDSEGKIHGVLSSIQTQKGHCYQITGVYNVDEFFGEIAIYCQRVKILTFSEIQTDGYNYSCNKMPSFVAIRSVVLSKALYNMGMPLIENGQNEFSLYMGDMTYFNLEVGDKFKYVGLTESGGTIVVPISVNESELCMEMEHFPQEINITGITSYIPIKRNQCYEVTGIYHIRLIGENDEMVEYSKRRYGYYNNFQIVTFQEIENDSSITKEMRCLSGFRYYVPFFKLEDEYSKHYLFLDEMWVGI